LSEISEGYWLAIDKPTGHTSHDVVAIARKTLQIRRIGHSGTLDPDVTGVLVLAVGKATRLIQYLPGGKVYRGKFKLGITTDSQDASGKILSEQPVPNLSEAELRSALSAFLGKQAQIPPMVSAVSYQGKRLYQLARKGIEIADRPARSIEIHRLELLSWLSPLLEIEVACSAGTYIRTLAHDLGQKLGCGAHLHELTRIEANGVSLQQCLPLAELKTSPEKAVKLAMDAPLAHLEALYLSQAEGLRFLRGQRFSPETPASPDQPLRIYAQNHFLGMGQIQAQELKSLCVFQEPQLLLELSSELT